MLKYRIISITFLGLLIMSLFYWSANPWIFASIVLVFMFISSLGAISIQLNLYLKAFNKAKTSEKKIALTFDDGPHTRTPEILSLLEKYQAKGNFFLIGERVRDFGYIVKQITEKGHLIGNHSYYHKNNFPISQITDIADEITKTNQAIEQATGQIPVYFRPPFGVTNPLVARAVKRTKMKVAGWTIRSYDTMDDSPEKILARIKRQIAPGKIILLHDYSTNILLILESLLKHLTDQGYQIVTLYELEDKK